MAIFTENVQILTIFGHFGGQKLFLTKNIWRSSIPYGDTTSCKNQKKYRKVKAVGPEHTYVRTDAQTDGRE